MADYNTMFVRREWWQTAKALNNEQRGQLFSLMCAYAFDNEEIIMPDPIISMLGTMIKPQLLQDREKLRAKLDKYNSIRVCARTDAGQIQISNNNNNNNNNNTPECNPSGESENDLLFYTQYFFNEGNSRGVIVARDYLDRYVPEKNIRVPNSPVILDSYPKPKNPMPEICRKWWGTLLVELGEVSPEMYNLTGISKDSFVPGKVNFSGLTKEVRERILKDGPKRLCAALSKVMGCNIVSFDFI